MDYFKIVASKDVWAGHVLLCEEPDGSWVTAHTATSDCRTGRYWIENFDTREQAQTSFDTRTF